MTTTAETVILHLSFDKDKMLPDLFGEGDRYLKQIQDHLNVKLHSRGHNMAIEGTSFSAHAAQTVLTGLYDRLKRGMGIDDMVVDQLLRMVLETEPTKPSIVGDFSWQDDQASVKTKRRLILPRTPTQAAYIHSIRQQDLVFGIGPAGTGKTYLAVAAGVMALSQGIVERIILSRPAVEAGERLGFLPGDLKEKVDPYLRPLYDALYDMLPAEDVTKRLALGQIEIAPLAYMRGRTLSNAFIILDEAQNTTAVQMKMFLTRLGENAKMVITGDLTQVDLPDGVKSGLKIALEVLHDVKGVGFNYFTEIDIVRHPLVARIVKAYDRHLQKNPNQPTR